MALLSLWLEVAKVFSYQSLSLVCSIPLSRSPFTFVSWRCGFYTGADRWRARLNNARLRGLSKQLLDKGSVLNETAQEAAAGA